jgi:hypothetical protein
MLHIVLLFHNQRGVRRVAAAMFYVTCGAGDLVKAWRVAGGRAMCLALPNSACMAVGCAFLQHLCCM